MRLNNPNTNSRTCIRGLGAFSVKAQRLHVLAFQLYSTLLQCAEQPDKQSCVQYRHRTRCWPPTYCESFTLVALTFVKMSAYLGGLFLTIQFHKENQY